jgi:integrase
MMVKLRGIKIVTNKKTGKKYAYDRISDEPIKAEPETAEFLAEVQALRSKIRTISGRGRSKYQKGSWGALVDAYLDSPEFANRRPRTKQDYQKYLAYLGSLNDASVISFTSKTCRQIRNKAFNQHGLRFANYVVEILSIVFNWGRANDWEEITGNPAARLKIARPTNAPESNRPHTEDEDDIILEEATGLLQIAIALGRYTSSRPGDVVKIRWSDYDGERIEWHQGKTGDLTNKPARRRLREILDAAPRHGEMILTRPDGRVWKYGTLSKSFRTLIARLEREGRVEKGLTFHGFRTTNATRLADRGADVRAIQAELGQRTAVMALHYSRKADMQRAADTASRILDDDGDNVIILEKIRKMEKGQQGLPKKSL